MTTPKPGPHRAGLLIGDIARLSGLTPRAVRHYHAVGLLPEPARDSSGYRRYGTADLIALVRIARLRALGMPVARIVDRVGHSNSGDLSDSLRVLAGELTEEIERLTRLRDRLEHAVDADSLDDPADTLARAPSTGSWAPMRPSRPKKCRLLTCSTHCTRAALPA